MSYTFLARRSILNISFACLAMLGRHGDKGNRETAIRSQVWTREYLVKKIICIVTRYKVHVFIFVFVLFYKCPFPRLSQSFRGKTGPQVRILKFCILLICPPQMSLKYEWLVVPSLLN